MSKLKTLGLCTLSALVTAGLLVSLEFHKWFGVNSSLTLVGPATVAKGDIVEFRANVANPAWFLSTTIYQWKVLNHNGEVTFKTIAGNDIFFPAGLVDTKFYVVCSAVNYYNYVVQGSVVPLDIVVQPVSVGTTPIPPGPVPPIPPVPPTPVPTPVTSKLFAMAIFDNTKVTALTPDQLAVHNSVTIAGELTPLNTTWKNYDKANPALADPSWQKFISSVTLPSLLIVDDKGKSYYSGVLTNENDVLAQVNKVRSGK